MRVKENGLTIRLKMPISLTPPCGWQESGFVTLTDLLFDQRYLFALVLLFPKG
jgi:hypothetical protein